MRKVCPFLMALLLSALTVFAQDRTVSGKVTDSKDGTPLAGVSVTVKGSSTGVQTDANGNFSISVPANARTLVFSYVGFGSEEASIRNSNTVDIALTSDDRRLQEVVVVGYGTQRRKAVTAAITKVDVTDINNLVTPSFDKQLAGRAAGVQVTVPSGLTNQEPRIRIRGVNSISYGRDPLIVIDGVPAVQGSLLQQNPTFGNINGTANGNSNTPVSGTSNNTGISAVTNTNALADISPNDIESIEVLKDGAATAIYGSRAANGVILITTKRGKQGKMNVNYNMYVGTFRPAKRYKLLNAQQFVTIANEKYTNAGQPAQAVMNAQNTDTDWQDEIFSKNPLVHSHSLSFDGATAATNYYFSFNYMSTDGLIKTNSSNRYSIRTNFSHKINKWVKVGNTLSISRVEDRDQNNGGNALSGAITAALRALPNVRAYDTANKKFSGFNVTPDGAALGADANLRPIDDNYVNIAYVLAKNKFRSEKYRVIENAYIEVTPMEDLTIRSQGSLDYQTSYDFLSYDPLHGDGRGSNGRVDNIHLSRHRYVWQNYANYNKSLGSHNFFLTAGTEVQRDVEKYTFGRGTNFSDPFFISDNLVSGSYTTFTSGGGIFRSGFVSYFGRVNYDFDSRYFLQLSFRRDGQSSLAKNVRFGNFPGASIGWRVSEENFWKKSGIGDVIDELKIRGSYAVVGNTLTGFPYLSTYGPAPYGGLNGIAIDAVGNNILQWETNKKLDAGIDISLLNRRFQITFDWYQNRNDDLVLAAPLPSSFGVPNNSIFRNIGDMKNYGFEFSLDARIMQRKNFLWTANFNFTSAKNKVVSLVNNQDVILPGPNNGTFNILRVGQPINALYGFQYQGVNSGNGNPLYLKANGTLVQANIAGTTYNISNGKNDPALGAVATLDAGDRVVLGNTLPTWFGGLSNNFNYKNWGLEVFFRYSGGNKIYNLTRQETLLVQGFQNNGVEILGRWQKPGDVTEVPKVWIGKNNLVNNQSVAISRFVENGDYIRLQNVVLSYTFDGKALEQRTKGIVRSLRFFAQGQNLWIKTDYSGLDPDNYSEFGIDNATTPQPRAFSVGLNIGF
ncbi:MAG TPA: TonB-dependent receptor [Chitinophagaceae bacterium]|nr:TonB-dependent receptor [Chitinophagaceae bacterium]